MDSISQSGVSTARNDAAVWQGALYDLSVPSDRSLYGQGSTDYHGGVSQVMPKARTSSDFIGAGGSDSMDETARQLQQLRLGSSLGQPMDHSVVSPAEAAHTTQAMGSIPVLVPQTATQPGVTSSQGGIPVVATNYTLAGMPGPYMTYGVSPLGVPQYGMPIAYPSAPFVPIQADGSGHRTAAVQAAAIHPGFVDPSQYPPSAQGHRPTSMVFAGYPGMGGNFAPAAGAPPADAGRKGGRRKMGHAGAGRSSPSPYAILAAQGANLTAEEIKGNVASMCRDQHGCRLLQQKLDDGDVRIRDIVYEEMLRDVQNLMMDSFGNYLFQKILEHCDVNGRMRIVRALAGLPDERFDETLSVRPPTSLAEAVERVDKQAIEYSSLVEAGLDIHGTRSVQKLIEVCRHPKEVDVLVGCLRGKFVRLSNDANGNHVVQRCLQHLPTAYKELVIDEIYRELSRVCQHRHGCCVVQRCIDFAESRQRDSLIERLVDECSTLMQDPFGNYVIQYVLEKGSWDQSRRIIDAVCGRVLHLSVQKFSSNVVEQCLQHADDELRKQLLDELSQEQTIGVLLHDQYGNYVVQKALAVANASQGRKLVEVIRIKLPAIAGSAVGKRITARIVKKFPDVSLSTKGGNRQAVASTSPMC